MKTSRKAIVLLMTGAMLLAATTGAFAQGYGRMGGSRMMTPGYGYHSMGPTSPGTGSLGYGPRGGFNGSSNPGFFGGMRMMGSSGYGALHYFQYQKLSTEDKAKVDKIVQDSSAQVLPLQNEIRAARLELDNLLWSASPDKSKIDEFVAKIANLQKQIQEVRATTIIEINAIFQATK